MAPGAVGRTAWRRPANKEIPDDDPCDPEPSRGFPPCRGTRPGILQPPPSRRRALPDAAPRCDRRAPAPPDPSPAPPPAPPPPPPPPPPRPSPRPPPPPPAPPPAPPPPAPPPRARGGGGSKVGSGRVSVGSG